VFAGVVFLYANRNTKCENSTGHPMEQDDFVVVRWRPSRDAVTGPLRSCSARGSTGQDVELKEPLCSFLVDIEALNSRNARDEFDEVRSRFQRNSKFTEFRVRGKNVTV
jgi:hypothetical protein